MALYAAGITKAYDNTKALSDVSLSINPGSATVLLGPSGSGKSTLLKCLGMLEYPNSGEISFEGRSYSFPISMSVEPPWPDVTVVFQQHFLWPHLTLRDNILLPLRKKLGPHEQEEILHGLIERFDMSDFIDRFPNNASGGERQRTALARALALQPRYILLDEVTSALDVEQVKNVLDLLIQLLNEGIGVLVVTHSLGFANAILKLNNSSEFIFLDDGEVIERGDYKSLNSPTSPRLAEFISNIKLAE